MTAGLLELNSVVLWSDGAVGDDAKSVRKQVGSAIEADRSVAFGSRHWQLEMVCAEASESNWDGYGGRAVDLSTYDRARVFLALLPRTIPDPDITVDPDGEVSFRWQGAHGEAFSVSIAGSGRLSYAALFAPTDDNYGTIQFANAIPAPVEGNLARLFASGLSTG